MGKQMILAVLGSILLNVAFLYKQPWAALLAGVAYAVTVAL